VGPGPDLIRTRLLFLEALSPAERSEFLTVVARQLDEAASEMRTLEREVRRSGDRISTLATRGALLVARARRDWFKSVCEELG
jgi:hypothetical protein